MERDSNAVGTWEADPEPHCFFYMSGASCSDRIFQRRAAKQVAITLGELPTMQTFPQHPGIPPTLDPTALISVMTA